jgi:hypothetical protein
MFGLFKKKQSISLIDLDGNPIVDGDIVESLRYDLGECRVFKTENGFDYESLKDGNRTSWLKMIDAATERQKVRKKNTL